MCVWSELSDSEEVLEALVALFVLLDIAAVHENYLIFANIERLVLVYGRRLCFLALQFFFLQLECFRIEDEDVLNKTGSATTVEDEQFVCI